MNTVDYGVVKVRPATPRDAYALSPRLRKADLDEIQAASGDTPETVLRRGIEHGRAYSIVNTKGEILGIFGVGTVAPRVGVVWLLGSDDLTKISYIFLRESRVWLRKLFDGHDLLANVIDARNTLHIRWLRWLGFHFVAQRPNYGTAGETFLEFCKLRPDEDKISTRGDGVS